MKQKEYVVDAMKRNGGYATLRQLNALVDVSSWGTKTPEATIRRIVQTYDEFFRIQPGLWALKAEEKAVLRKFKIVPESEESKDTFTHSYFQGILVEIGNRRGCATYIPPQDKNKLFLENKLFEIATVEKIYNFTYAEILKRAKTVDVIWFNERKMPRAFYEVEHTTDMKNSLNKFYELQDFRAEFYIVADKKRRKYFNDAISASIYAPIRSIVHFVDYDALVEQYNGEKQIKKII